MFTKLIFDKEMENFLYKTGQCNRLSSVLLHSNINSFLSSEGNFIKREEDDLLSYLPKSKYTKELIDDSPYQDGIGRIKIKVGRFAKKFILPHGMMEYGISSGDIERFVNLFKSYFNSNPENLKIVQGDDILKFYSQSNYFTPDGGRYGSLWNSCMRHEERNKYMELYSKNSFIKMLVLFDDGGKIRARALLWDGVEDKNGNQYKIMDRIYTIFDHDVNFFKSWAIENGYIPKFDQSAKTESIFDINGKPTRLELKITLEKSDFEFYPYLDSFKFYDEVKGILSNTHKFTYRYVLTQVDGGLEPRAREDVLFDGGNFTFEMDPPIEVGNEPRRFRENGNMGIPRYGYGYGHILGTVNPVNPETGTINFNQNGINVVDTDDPVLDENTQ